jgi:flavorubredoxin
VQTTVDEIATGIYRLSTFAADVGPRGFSYNQFLIDSDEPLLFHCGKRSMFPSVAEAVARVMPVKRLRWISFGHVEADECGAMNQWLAAAPRAIVAFGALGCAVSVDDLADRAPRPLADGEIIDLGTHRIQQMPTPHVPHGWEAQVLYEQVTGTLLCGDLFTQVGPAPALVHDDDLISPALEAVDIFKASCLTPQTAPTMRGLAELEPTTLGLMHGPSYAGMGGQALRDLANAYDALLDQKLDEP